MKQVTILTIVACIALLTGCASVPMTSASMDAQAKTFQPDSGKASVYVTRTGGAGSALVMQTVLDGRIVGSLSPDTFLLVSVPPGRHTVSVLGGGGSENVQQQKLTAESGRNYFFKVHFSMGWWAARVSIEPLDDQEGQKLIKRSKRAETSTDE